MNKKYFSRVFDVENLEQAKHVVLTADPSNPNKFNDETNFLVNVIRSNLDINENTVILDYGCGMGRISRELIQRFNCNVIGVDISPSMLIMARVYVYDTNILKFKTTQKYNEPNSVDIVLAILSLQHAEHPKKEIDNIVSVLKDQGWLILLNENARHVPVGVDEHSLVIWEDDGFDIFSYCESQLKLQKSVNYMNKHHNILFYQKVK